MTSNVLRKLALAGAAVAVLGMTACGPKTATNETNTTTDTTTTTPDNSMSNMTTDTTTTTTNNMAS
jgi:hypothetical protein